MTDYHYCDCDCHEEISEFEVDVRKIVYEMFVGITSENQYQYENAVLELMEYILGKRII